MIAPGVPTPPAVSAALTTTEVQVTSGFKGARIVLYGAIFDPGQRPSDVVVLVRGPEQPIRIAHKIRIAGLWINSRPVIFQGAPGFYMAASTRPLAQIAGRPVLQGLGAGLDHLAFDAPAEHKVETRYGVKDVVVNRLGFDYPEWRRAVVRLKSRMGLYDEDDHGVVFVDRNLFKAEINLPTDAPIGRYQAQILLFQEGRPVSSRLRHLEVRKVGLQRALYLFAHLHPWTYGLVSVSIALAAGWAASAAFRRS